MKQQNLYDLYDGTPPHERASATSHAAAKSIVASADTLRARVLFAISKLHGATCDEVEEATGMRHQTCSARVRELFLKGMIRDSEARRKTRSGRTAVVWLANR